MFEVSDRGLKYAGVLELADKQASDTCVFNMRVQIPSPAPKRQRLPCGSLCFFSFTLIIQ